MARSVTVFGGTGYLGQHIVRRLLADGWQVRVAARRVDAVAGDGVEPFRADITDPDAVRAAVVGVAAVVNAVALYVERGRATFEAVHVDAAGRLGAAAREAGIERLVHVSGIGADSRSRSAYVAARGRGEERLRAAMPEATLLRPSVLFGPGDAFLSTLDAVSRLPVVPLFGRGLTRLQPVHVDDVARAAARALDGPPRSPRLFELGGADVLVYRDVLRLVLRCRGRRRPLLPVPFPLWHALAAACGPLPRPPLTRDQVILMQQDNVVPPRAAGLRDLGIEPRGLRGELPHCLPAG